MDVEGDGTFLIYGLGFAVRGSRESGSKLRAVQVLARPALARWHSARRDRVSASTDAKRVECVGLAGALGVHPGFDQAE